MSSRRVVFPSLAVVLSVSALAGCGVGSQQYGLGMQSPDSLSVTSQSVPGQLLVGYTQTRPAISADILRDDPAIKLQLVAPAAGQSMADLQATLKQQPGVAFVEPNWVIPAPSVAPRVASLATAPILGFDLTSDPLESKQWQLAKINAPQAWKYSTGRGVTVAVIDTGVDETHPDLQANLVPGYNTLENNSDPHDDNGHGTNVAGIIAEVGGNGIGGIGVAPDAKIMPVRALGEQGGTALSVSTAIQYAADHGANIINMSLGSSQSSQAIQSAVNYALGKGVIVVVAMGNDGQNGNPTSYPAAYQGVIAVGATNPQDQVTPWSDWGSWEAVSAPGYGIWATFPNYDCALLDIAKQNPQELPPEDSIQEGYAAISGTSQATPVVSGVVALMKSIDPSLTPAQARQDLMATARSTTGGFDDHYGAGIVDALAAVRSVQQ